MYRSLMMGAACAAILTASILGTAGSGVAAGFIETDLVVNKTGLTDSNGVAHPPPTQTAPVTVDAHLLNPWGLATSSTSPFWVSDNGAGVSTLYNAAGVPQPQPTPQNPTAHPLIVSIPTLANPLANMGTPTGVVFNIVANTSSPFTFPITGGNGTQASARFIFATEDGTIVGWNPAINPAGSDPAKAGTCGIIATRNPNVLGGGLQRIGDSYRR